MNFAIPVLVIHVLAALAIIGLVLLQHGKGADMGAAFGSGSAGSVFGSSGSANFLSRSTAVAAVVFFATSITLTYLGASRPGTLNQGVMKNFTESAVPAPANSAGSTGSTGSSDKSVPAAANPVGNAVPASSSVPAAAVPATPAAPASTTTTTPAPASPEPAKK